MLISCHNMEISDNKSNIYKSSMEYLLDECKRIELLLIIELKKHNKTGNSLHINKSYFISEEEINEMILHPREKKSLESAEEIRTLKAEFVKLCKDITRKKNNSIKNSIFLSLFILQKIFGLSDFEMDLIILCLLPEIHRKYERLYGYIQDDITLKKPALCFIANLFSSSEESQFALLTYFLQDNTLFKYNILTLHDDSTDSNKCLSSKSLAIDKRILNYIFEVNELNPFIAPYCSLLQPRADIKKSRLAPPVKENLLKILNNHLNSSTKPGKLFVNLNGSYGSGRNFFAEALCKKAGILLLLVDTEELIKAEIPFKSLVKEVFREAILQQAAIYFKNIKSLFCDDEKAKACRKLFFKIADELSWITFLSGDYSTLSKLETLSNNICVNVDFPCPDNLGRKKIWMDVLHQESIQIPETDIIFLSNKFKFTEGQIRNAIRTARNVTLQHNGTDSGHVVESLYEGCRLQSNHKLSTLSRRITSHQTWGDLVLPANRLTQLKEISSHIKYKDIVYDRWGFNKKLSLGRGLNILFSGPSGTGKTMASGIIANDLGLELYKIDLSFVVSKYIGETEKNLAQVFKEAETSNAILFFDEADALFGKRSEIKDAHDRYANVEINFLLQKMEEHDGVVILATNLSKNIDSAFLRRMQFVVEFPFPDKSLREQIWRSIFPGKAPLAKDIVYEFLSDKLEIAGGNIKNIAVLAAFYAARESAKIDMRHIMRAAKREYQKIGKSFLKADFEPYYGLVGD